MTRLSRHDCSYCACLWPNHVLIPNIYLQWMQPQLQAFLNIPADWIVPPLSMIIMVGFQIYSLHKYLTWQYIDALTARRQETVVHLLKPQGFSPHQQRPKVWAIPVLTNSCASSLAKIKGLSNYHMYPPLSASALEITLLFWLFTYIADHQLPPLDSYARAKDIFLPNTLHFAFLYKYR